MAERKRPKTLMDLADLPGPAGWGQEDPRPGRRGSAKSGGRKKSSGRSGSGVKKQFVKKKNSLFFRLVLGLFWLGLAGLVMGVAALIGAYAYFSQDLPPVEGLVKDYSPPTVTYVYSDDGRVIGEYYHQRRFVASISDIPRHVLNAFVAVEDADFRRHNGVNPKATIRAFIANYQAGRTVQGGSTITMQVAKNFLLTRERSYIRKIKEMILAMRMEKIFSKDEILGLYLNDIYLGQQAYGVEGAARTYFDKSAKDMTVAEAAMLAGLVQAPGANNPIRNPEKARERQQFAIKRMKDVGFITEAEAAQYSAEVLHIRDSWPNPNTGVAPYFTEHVRRLMEEMVGEDSLYNDGWKIYTTVNIEAQQAADRAVARGLWEYARRRGYRGPDAQLKDNAEIEAFLAEQTSRLDDEALRPDRLYQAVIMEVDGAKSSLSVRLGPYTGHIAKKNLDWALKGQIKQQFHRGDVVWVRLSDDSGIAASPAEPKNAKDLAAVLASEAPPVLEMILERRTDVQSALLSMDLSNGDVKAMVGGRDFSESQFNRAVQSQRQPGSSFKPILYASALDHGFTPGSIMLDAPVVIDDLGSRRRWKPVNSDLKFKGPMTLFAALVGSRNLISIKLLDRIGFEALDETARNLGITEKLPRSLTVALGAHGLHMPELLSAYSAFANMGLRVEPRYITRIENRSGQVVAAFEPQRIPSLDPGTACAVTWMLRGVVEQGTGTVVKPLGRPVGAKTGTTNDYSDAWMVGFTPELATAVWVGTDQQRPRAVGEVGGRAAGPIFLYYMQDVLKDRPVTDFTVPPEAEVVPGGTSFGVCYKAGTVGTGLSESAGSAAQEEEFLRDDFGGEGDYSDDGFEEVDFYNSVVYDGSVDVPASTVSPRPPASAVRPARDFNYGNTTRLPTYGEEEAAPRPAPANTNWSEPAAGDDDDGFRVFDIPAPDPAAAPAPAAEESRGSVSGALGDSGGAVYDEGAFDNDAYQRGPEN